MKNWKSWIAVSALSLGLVGCAPAANNAQDTSYHGAGTNGYRSLATDDSAYNLNGVNPNATANFNDQGINYPGTTNYPGMYTKNSIYQDGTRTLNRNANTMGVQTKTKYQTNNYGYAVYSKRDMNQQQASTFFIDRNVLARAVSTVVTSIPGVERSNVLVTDEDLFIGLPGVTDKSTLNKAKLAAWSISPRYYKVYVTGNQKVINQVNGLVNRAGAKHLNQDHLDHILSNGNFTDMTGTNVTDNGQNQTNYNMNKTFPSTNGTHRMKHQ